MSGSHRVTALDVFERIADGLGMPPEARLALGLAPSALYLGSATAIPPGMVAAHKYPGLRPARLSWILLVQVTRRI